MKRLLFIMGAFCLLFYACKKDRKPGVNEPLPNSPKYAVKFNISDFHQSVEGFSSKLSSRTLATVNAVAVTPASLLESIHFIEYIVYNAEGKEINRKKQDSTGYIGVYKVGSAYNGEGGIFPFGSIPDSLATGIYTVVICAAKNNIGINSRSDMFPAFSPLTDAYFIYERGLAPPFSRSSDAFFKKFSLTVGNQDMEKSVSLNRIVGKVEITLQDAIPTNAHHFLFQFINENEGYKFSDETPFGYTLDQDDDVKAFLTNPVNSSEIGKTGYVFTKHIINTTTPLDIIISCYDVSNTLIATKTVNGVQCYKNKRTILKGNLFSTSNPLYTFSISVNNQWDSNVNEISF